MWGKAIRIKAKIHLISGYGKAEMGPALRSLVETLLDNCNHSFLVTLIWKKSAMEEKS